MVFILIILKILKAIAGSNVVPDLDITLTETFLSLQKSNISFIWQELTEFPTKNIFGILLKL